jgi:hypothetical protein
VTIKLGMPVSYATDFRETITHLRDFEAHQPGDEGADLDYIGGGRCVLGLGAAGPQVGKGSHGVRWPPRLGVPASSSGSV